MKRTIIGAGLFLCASTLFALAQPHQANALSLPDMADEKTAVTIATPFIETLKPDTQPKEETLQIAPPKPVEHVVQPGESLTTIANQYQVTWKRLYDKNTAVESPDVITVNEHLIVPDPAEVLPERAVPVAAPVDTQEPDSKPVTTKSPPAKTKTASYAVGSSSGNTYSPGYCTWYAKSRRPDLPNNLGNAITWVSRAAGQGIATGSAPRVGAIGQSGNHVVYVESVNGDGTVTVSEMNYEGWGVVSSRTVSAGSFGYIY